MYRPTWVMVPMLWAAMSRYMWEMTPWGRLYASILLLRARSPSLGARSQWPPMTRLTMPSWP